MKTGLILLLAAVLAVVCEARFAEKVSEDDDFVVYRIPVKALDLQTQASAQSLEGYDFGPSFGRSSSKSSSHSKSSSSSTGTGKGRGYGKGGSSEGHGHGYGGSSSGHGYGGGSSGHGHGHGGSSGGHGYGSGGSGHGSGGSGHGYGSEGHGYGSGGQGYGSGGYSTGTGHGYGGSGSGSGHGGSGSGYGGSYRGSRIRPRYTSGYFSSDFDRYQSYFPSSGSKFGGGYSPSYGGSSSPSYGGYSPSYDSGSQGHAPHYDEEDDDAPKVITTTKTVTTGSAQDTGLDKLNSHGRRYRQTDSLGDITFKLGDYLKNAPGHEASSQFNKYFKGASSEFNPGYRSGQGFNVNEFTRTLNQGLAGNFNSPSFRNNKFIPQASFVIPTAYAMRHAGFGLPVF